MPLAGAAQQSLAAAGLQQQQLVFLGGDGKVVELWDPSSVLEHSAATSTLSSPLSDVAAAAFFAGGNNSAWPPGDEDGGKEDWVHHHLDMAATWDPPAAQHQQQVDNPFLRCIMEDTRPPPPPLGFADQQFHTKLPVVPLALNPVKASAVEQLAEAARLAEAGNMLSAREILARLNLPTPSGRTTPLHRSALYLKEALLAAIDSSSMASTTTPVDVVLKLGAYQAFSEVSPVIQFAHFTCVQAVLDQLGGNNAAPCMIHVLDFDIGVGEQWASLMRELPPGAALKVTALVDDDHHHNNPLELQLVHENLSNFAAETGVPFQFAVFNLDATEELMASIASGGDAIAVHLPAEVLHHLLLLLRRLAVVAAATEKKLVVVTVDRGCRGQEDLLQWCACLLESLDAVGTAPDVSAKIERFLIQPTIQRCIVNKLIRTRPPRPSWRSMLASSGFVPVQASSLAEAQAESLLNKMPGWLRGFRVEKRAGSLSLHWQRGHLVSVTAWTC